MLIPRKLAEKWSRRVVLKRRLPKDLGGIPLYVTPDAALSYWRRDLERVDPMLLRLVRRLVKTNSCVWDIGANVGLFGFAAAARASRVLIVEPDAWLVTLLNRSAANYTNVTVLPAAVSDSLGIAELNIAQRGRAANFVSGFGTSQTGGARQQTTVVTVTLDWLVERFPPPAVLKIDVEGMQHQVLRGAQELLRCHRPVVICEVNSDQNLVTEILHSLHYDLCNEHLELVPRAAVNTVAFPAELRASILEE
ncbi:MAG: FkbM family methyltransferase [Acidobacteria bacterium]|jgi:FkbM family methyltransferase|nr:FkbM family methyltransferase [Acidobacteriota bacterium]